MKVLVNANELMNTVEVLKKGLANCSECPCDSEHADNGAFECVLME